jgi:hypothetical protein
MACQPLVLRGILHAAQLVTTRFSACSRQRLALPLPLPCSTARPPMFREFKAAAFAMLVLFAADASGGRTADGGAPATAVDGVSDVYHGVTVADPYRWLENGADPNVHDWSVAQDKRTQAYLNALTKALHQITAVLAPLTS